MQHTRNCVEGSNLGGPLDRLRNQSQHEMGRDMAQPKAR
jgi:hypothetical protein